jgi:hypothetical protein
MDVTSLLKEIDAEIARLEVARSAVAGLSSSPVAPVKRGRGRPKGSTNSAKPKKRTMSPEGRARIAAAMKKRWAAKKEK